MDADPGRVNKNQLNKGRLNLPPWGEELGAL